MKQVHTNGFDCTLYDNTIGNTNKVIKFVAIKRKIGNLGNRVEANNSSQYDITVNTGRVRSPAIV